MAKQRSTREPQPDKAELTRAAKPTEAGPLAEDTLLFLGTAGARIMVSKQLLASGGFWLNLSGTQILVDPGPGCLVQAARRKLDPAKLDAILLSHKHLDHSGDVNVMIEAITEGGFKKRGTLLTPLDALENDPVVLRYLRGFLAEIQVLTEGGKYQVGKVEIETPLRHRHPVETYGVIFGTPRYTISYIADTRYFDELCARYRGELLIINVLRLEPDGPFDHLSVADVACIVQALRPKVAILNHFGMTMWRARPWEQAERLSQETGVKVIAARDGMRFDLKQLQ